MDVVAIRAESIVIKHGQKLAVDQRVSYRIRVQGVVSKVSSMTQSVLRTRQFVQSGIFWYMYNGREPRGEREESVTLPVHLVFQFW